jgi:hypothetical protein
MPPARFSMTSEFHPAKFGALHPAAGIPPGGMADKS